ncbi:zinc finger protein 12-like [Physella acuta]|uniref:zinc finger protein 12-like n=1 Tax=Physella acuta TaxID=109671 RepID=UPI0027DCD4D7|nr:zinc finger protein 12-like [Physella acuta]
MEFPIEIKPDVLNISPYPSESLCDIKNLIKSEIDDFTELQNCVETITYNNYLKYGNTLTCNLCNKKYVSMKFLNTHLRQHLSDTSLASLAQMESILESRGKRQSRHVIKNSSSKKTKTLFICDVCGKSYTRKSSLNIHYTKHKKLMNYDCYVCHKVFYSSFALKEHIFLHSIFTNSLKSGLPVVCNLCNQHFLKMVNIKQHMYMHLTEKPQPKTKPKKRERKRKEPCVCDICGKVYSHERLLKKHYVVHSKVKPYLCDICGKSYASISYLNDHYRGHSNSIKKQHTCEQCGLGFLHRHALYRHRFVHLKENTFKCVECDKSFSAPTYLKIHNLRTHIKDKVFPCEHCNKSFFLKYMLQRHMIVHTTARPCLCTICGKLFKRKSSLRDHLLRHKKRNQVPLS